MDQKQRELIAILKLCPIIGVVFIHTPRLFQSSIVIEIFSERIPVGCVSGFFLLSGYLLLKKDLLNLDNYKTEIIKRTKTLVVPFLFWNILIFILASLLFQINPDMSNGGNYTVNLESVKESIFAILGIQRYPIHYQFWFIRNLIIIVICSPIFTFFLKKYPVARIPIFFVIESFFKGFGFFYLGGLIYEKKNNLSLDKKDSIVVFVVSITILVLFWIKLKWFLFWKFISFLFFFSLANIILMSDELKNLTLKISEYTFIIYAMHEPTLTLITRVITRVLGGDELISKNWTIAYFLIACISICLSVLIGKIWQKISFKTYQLATGNR